MKDRKRISKADIFGFLRGIGSDLLRVTVEGATEAALTYVEDGTEEVARRVRRAKRKIRKSPRKEPLKE